MKAAVIGSPSRAVSWPVLARSRRFPHIIPPEPPNPLNRILVQNQAYCRIYIPLRLILLMPLQG